MADRTDSSLTVPEGTILGLDNVFLELPIAGVGSRILATVLDTFLQLLVQLVWVLVWFLPGRSGLGTWSFVIYMLGAFLIDSAYFAGLEIAMRGRTPGKKAMRLRVVTRTGGTPSPGQLLTRNLVRLVDIFVGVPLMAIDPLARRLGDRLAGTIVLHEEERGGAGEAYLRRIPSGWSSEDVALVESVLRRASELEPGRADAMAAKILARIEREQPEFLVGVWREGGPLAAVRHAFGVESV